MERDRLHRDLVANLEQLKASRLRILQAGDEERRRLERNLHDGAQQRLTAALLGLRAVAGEVEDDPALGPRAADALADLEGAIADLRELARGLDPPLLARQGLAAAIRAGAARGCGAAGSRDPNRVARPCPRTLQTLERRGHAPLLQ